MKNCFSACEVRKYGRTTYYNRFIKFEKDAAAAAAENRELRGFRFS